MPTQLLNTTNSQCNSTAAIRSWAGQIEATFLAGGAGWIQTSDTGQTAAASLPTGVANTPSGYEIFKMNDSLQATYPVFVKIEYGAAGTTSTPAIWLTIGTGSDGAGNITGVLLARTQYFPGNVGVASSPSWGSASTNRMAFAFGQATGNLIFGIERSKNTDGTDSGDGLLVLVEASSGTATAVYKVFQYIRFISNTLPNSTIIGAFTPSNATWADSANFGVSPVSFFNGQPSNPCLNWLLYLNGDTAAQVSLPITLYGAAHIFMPFGSAYSNNALGITGANANSSLMMRWE